ncbi:zinc metallopeptidase [Aerococcaceae bacterium zg-BR9]|uniref:zinc metallopeptidase n=1 Tax=Aerococcaceae bacterium zg-1292 TaxID=2774330 RepID=UPI004063E807|nr:zinc metallopeptidase [Aerococcaceae bacterium zg-BR9]MBF6626279.1 zinc metallopeptidase [Aerococcaceae bacterium zg-BR9]
MYNYGFDSTYFLVIIGAMLVMYAQTRVKSTFNKFSEWETTNRVTGRQAAQTLLQASNIHNVSIEHIPGHLSDHYDSQNKVLRLSDATDQETSIAAVAVAAHECGHALQDAENYGFLRMRNAFVPIAQLGSSLSMPLLMIGLVMNLLSLVWLGIIAFSAALLFQIITLPVEFDASKRALVIMEQYHLVEPDEIPAAKKVLNAAAFTYIASTLNSALTLLRFILMAQRRRD